MTIPGTLESLVNLKQLQNYEMVSDTIVYCKSECELHSFVSYVHNACSSMWIKQWAIETSGFELQRRQSGGVYEWTMGSHLQ